MLLFSGIIVCALRRREVKVELGYCELEVGRKKLDMAKSLLLCITLDFSHVSGWHMKGLTVLPISCILVASSVSVTADGAQVVVVSVASALSTDRPP